MTSLFEFITMAFPKAGIQVSGLPITINMVLFGVVTIVNFKYIPKYLKLMPSFIFPYYLLVMFVVISVLINIGNGTITAMTIAMTAVVTLSPLAGLSAMALSTEKSFKIVSISSIVTGGYMIIQKIFGIIATSIAGVSYTYGQDLAHKNIGYTGDSSSAVGEASKMPSTYQNGNSVGLFLATSLALLLSWTPDNSRWKTIRKVGIVMCLIGLTLCGSRSILFPMLLVSVFIFFGYFRKLNGNEKKSLFINIFLFLLTLLLFLKITHSDVLNQLVERYITQTIENPTSNRSSMWADGWQYINNLNLKQFISFGIIGAPNDAVGSDGMMGFLLNRGIIAQLLFIACLGIPIVQLMCKKETRIVAWSLVAVFIAFILDMSFYYLPCVMNFYLAFAIAGKSQNSDVSITKIKGVLPSENRYSGL